MSRNSNSFKWQTFDNRIIMDYRFSTKQDIYLLAEWNKQLIKDEGHRNKMSLVELRNRMVKWLQGEYKAVIFEDDLPVAYALFTENADRVYLRQFFVAKEYRRQGIGREAIKILRDQVFPRNKRQIIGVLTDNTRAVDFWHEVGFKDYSLTLEIMPEGN